MGKEHYALLNLYKGTAPQGTCDEAYFLRLGKYISRTERDFLTQELKRAKVKVEEGLGRDLVQIVYGGRFIQTETDAKELIKFAEENIPGAQGTCEPLKSAHGVILFYRQIRFNGYSRGNQSDLIEMLTRSDFRPKTQVEVAYEMMLEHGLGNNSLQKELDRMDKTKGWKQRLSFHKRK